jgi:hypothetical protein
LALDANRRILIPVSGCPTFIFEFDEPEIPRRQGCLGVELRPALHIPFYVAFAGGTFGDGFTSRGRCRDLPEQHSFHQFEGEKISGRFCHLVSLDGQGYQSD